jgi:hypothetical protein
MKYGLSVVIAALLVTGCAEKWAKPGASKQDFEMTKSACSTQAYGRFPPMINQVQLSSGHYTPVTTQCTSAGNTQTCRQSGGQYVPPQTALVDINDNGREQAVRSCLYQNGWQVVDDN